MSVARPVARSLFSGRLALPSPSPSSRLVIAPCHHFHSSAQLSARKRPARTGHKGRKSTELSIPEDVATTAEEMFPKRTRDDMKQFLGRYNPEQMRAIEAADKVIDTKELAERGRFRIDSYRMPYLDDFSDIQPVIDKRPKREAPPDPNARFMALDEFTKDLIDWADTLRKGKPTRTLKKLSDFVDKKYRKTPEKEWPDQAKLDAVEKFKAYQKELKESKEKAAAGPTDADVLSYILERSIMTDNNAKSNSEMAPGLPTRVPGVAGRYKAAIDPEDEGLDDEGVYQSLKQRTGMSVREILSIQIKTFKPRWVSNQTRLGKVRSTSTTCIAGNGNGWLGVGQAKSVEPMVATRQAALYAIQNMRPIRRYEDRTIYGNIESKISGTVVRLYSRPPGFGLRVPHHIFEIARAAGIRDLSCKIPRSRSILNSVKATYDALLNQPDPEEIAMGRGKKLVDARKVYYGGNVY